MERAPVLLWWAAMNRSALIPLLTATAFAIGCGDKDSNNSERRQSAASAPKPTAVRAAPEAPKALAYSDAVADDLVAKLATCTSSAFCDPYKPLRQFGPKVSERLARVATDAKAKSSYRRVALSLLKEIEDPKVAMTLFEAARAHKSFIERYDLYEAAAASGGDEIFKAMTSFYDSKAGQEHQLQMRRGLRRFGPELIAWAAERMKKTKDEVAIADLIFDAAKSRDKDTVVALLKTCKHRMACHRLAATAIRLGEVEQFEVLLAGLRSKDVYDRSDAANFFAKVAKTLPASKKTEAIELLEAGKAKDRGGLTARGYSRSLQVLRAN